MSPFLLHFKHDKRRLALLDARTGKERLRLSDDIGQNGGVAFSPDGRLLAIVNAESGVDIFDLAQDKLVANLPQTDYASVLAFSPDGSRLASGGHMGTILLWDVGGLKQELPASGQRP
jgi:WD40 repeat protein